MPLDSIFQVGDGVHHSYHGYGAVVDVDTSGDTTRVVCRFGQEHGALRLTPESVNEDLRHVEVEG